MAECLKIINGPNLWDLIIGGLSRHGAEGSVVVFGVTGRASRGEKHVIVTCLNSDWRLREHVKGVLLSPDLDVLEKAVGPRFDWDNAWWFEGHSPKFRTLPVWGIYSPVTRKGALSSAYTGPSMGR